MWYFFSPCNSRQRLALIVLITFSKSYILCIFIHTDNLTRA